MNDTLFDELQARRNLEPQWQLPPTANDYAAAHVDAGNAARPACPHRQTYVVAGRAFCRQCGRKVGDVEYTT